MASAKTCGICSKDFVKPKLLPCFHSFCEDCLNDYIHQHLHDHKFNCPGCQTEVQLPAGGTRDFTDNFMIKPKRDDGKYFCSVHDTMELKFYCTDCSLIICSDCAIVNHKNHTFVDYNDSRLVNEARENLQTLKTDLKKKLNEFHSHRDVIETKFSEIQKSTDQTCEQIDRKVKQIVTEATMLAETMKEKVNDIREKQNRKLNKVKSENQASTDIAERGLEFTRAALNEENHIPPLSIDREVTALVEKIHNERMFLPELKYGYIHFPQRQVNIEVLQKELGDLQILPERRFYVTFKIEEVTSKNVFWKERAYVVGCLPWYVGCMKTDQSQLGLYLKLKEGDYSTLVTCQASYALKLINNKDDNHSMTIQEDFPKTFLSGGVGGWAFLDWKRLVGKGGFIDAENVFKIQATVKIQRLDTK